MESKIRLRQAVVVEGKYDKNKLASLIDGTILCTDGFRIYKDRQLSAMIRAIARKQGIVILTDSDRAGFRIRSYIKSIAQGAEVVNLYIPQLPGKERRKAEPGAEGILGVEGIDVDILRELFRKAGLCVQEAEIGQETEVSCGITRADFYEAGLMGGTDAAARRAALLKKLDLPGYLTTNALLEIINTLMTQQEYQTFCGELNAIKR